MPFQFRKEAIEEDLNSNFPSQGQGNPPLYYSLSEVVVPTYSINSVAEGSGLPEVLQQAWDFSTGNAQINNASYQNVITNTGFWLVDLTYAGYNATTGAGRQNANVDIYDGITSKPVWGVTNSTNQAAVATNPVIESKFVVFLRSGDILRARTQNVDHTIDIWYRQIATVNGQLVNPLGFSFA